MDLGKDLCESHVLTCDHVHGGVGFRTERAQSCDEAEGEEDKILDEGNDFHGVAENGRFDVPHPAKGIQSATELSAKVSKQVTSGGLSKVIAKVLTMPGAVATPLAGCWASSSGSAEEVSFNCSHIALSPLTATDIPPPMRTMGVYGAAAMAPPTHPLRVLRVP